MFLSIRAIDKRGVTQHLQGEVDELELAVDLFSYLVAQGNTLEEASILDGTRWVKLPLAAFDKQTISPAFRQLEQEWKKLLEEDN